MLRQIASAAVTAHQELVRTGLVGDEAGPDASAGLVDRIAGIESQRGRVLSVATAISPGLTESVREILDAALLPDQESIEASHRALDAHDEALLAVVAVIEARVRKA